MGGCEVLEHYAIQEFRGRKVIYYGGFYWYGEGSWHEECAKSCLAYIDEIDGDVYEYMTSLFENCQQYGGEISDEYFKENSEWWYRCGKELHMSCVTQDTPCGDYWFELYEA